MASYGETEKKDIISKYRLSDKDCGSVELQVALLTHRINHLVEHLKAHKHDQATRHGLLKLVGQRKKFFKHLESTKPDTLKSLKKKLKLKVK